MKLKFNTRPNDKLHQSYLLTRNVMYRIWDNAFTPGNLKRPHIISRIRYKARLLIHCWAPGYLRRNNQSYYLMNPLLTDRPACVVSPCTFLTEATGSTKYRGEVLLWRTTQLNQIKSNQIKWIRTKGDTQRYLISYGVLASFLDSTSSI